MVQKILTPNTLNRLAAISASFSASLAIAGSSLEKIDETNNPKLHNSTANSLYLVSGIFGLLSGIFWFVSTVERRIVIEQVVKNDKNLDITNNIEMIEVVTVSNQEELSSNHLNKILKTNSTEKDVRSL